MQDFELSKEIHVLSRVKFLKQHKDYIQIVETVKYIFKIKYAVPELRGPSSRAIKFLGKKVTNFITEVFTKIN